MLLYQTSDGASQFEVRMEDETVWLSLNQIAELFQRDKSVISKHIKNIFEEGELKPESVVASFATTAVVGKTYQVDYYNLFVAVTSDGSHHLVETKGLEDVNVSLARVARQHCGVKTHRR